MSEQVKFPKFGDWVRGNYASEDNPRRDGIFVRVIESTGRLNPGIWYELTDGNGNFWRYAGKDTTRITAPPRSRAEGEDAARLRALVDFDAVSVNKWLVQARRGDSWGSVYFADPPGGPAKNKAPSKLDALRAAIDAAIQAAVAAGGK